MHGSSNCIGCWSDPMRFNSPDEPPKPIMVEDWMGRKRSISEYMSTSTCDMDSCAILSRGSASSISTIRHSLDQNGSTGLHRNSQEFVNHGLLLWNQTRQSWVGNENSEKSPREAQEPKLNWNATYSSLLGSNKPFTESIPLCEMVDFLVEIWERDGLHD